MAGRQIRRGTAAERVALGGLAAGELGFETDTEDVYIGAAAGDELISDKSARDFLNGQDQAVKTTSNPKFSGMFGSQVMVGGPAAFGAGLLHNGENPVLPLAMEESLLFDGDRLDAWYRNTSDSKIYYTYSDDPMAEVWSTPLDISTGTDLGGMNFPYVFQVGATYYMAGVVDHGGGFGNALYLWESTDKITWTFANSGAPILQHSANGADWWYTIYNPAIVVIGGTWHLLIEGKTSTSSFQTGYSYSTLADGPNFDTHLSAAPVLPGYTGNPHLVSVPDRSAILAIYGDVPEGTWTLRAASCLLASVFFFFILRRKGKHYILVV